MRRTSQPSSGRGATTPRARRFRGEVVNAILDGASPLRAWRQYRGLTLDVLADRVGVSKGYLSQMEQGRKAGTLRVFRRLADALGAFIDDLAGWENERDGNPARQRGGT